MDTHETHTKVIGRRKKGKKPEKDKILKPEKLSATGKKQTKKKQLRAGRDEEDGPSSRPLHQVRKDESPPKLVGV